VFCPVPRYYNGRFWDDAETIRIHAAMSLEELEDEDGKPVTPASWKDLIPLNRKVSLTGTFEEQKKAQKEAVGRD
jgi:hypothetical protein